MSERDIEIYENFLKSEHERSLRHMETMANALDVVYKLLETPPVNPPAGESGGKVRLWDGLP